METLENLQFTIPVLPNLPLITTQTSEDLSSFYSLITSNIYQGETLSDITAEIKKVQEFLQQESLVLGLVGVYKSIHLVLFLEQLGGFTVEEKQQYCNLFGLDYYNDGLLISEKYKNMELLRYYNYVNSVLFANNRNEFGGTFNYFQVPTVQQILYNDIRYYYHVAGELTIEAILQYKRYEILTMTAQLFRIARKQFIIQVDTRQEDLAGFLLLGLEETSLDPRMVITMEGPVYIHNNRDYNLNTFTTYISDACTKMGINIQSKPLTNLYNEYCISQVKPTFFLIPDSHRSIPEQIENSITKLNTLVLDIKTPIYYGIGDGIEKYQVFEPKELITYWKQMNKFWNPISEIEFSQENITRLLFLLDGTKETELASLIIKLLSHIKYPEIPPSIKLGTGKVDLVTIFNIGIAWSDWAKRMASENVLDLELRFNPRYSQPEWRQRIRNNVQGQVAMLQQVEDNGELWVTRDQVNFDTTDLLNTIEGMTEIVISLNNLGLFEPISYLGNTLMATGNFYMKYIFGNYITDNVMDFTYSEDEIPLIKAVYSLESVYKTDTTENLPEIQNDHYNTNPNNKWLTEK